MWLVYASASAFCFGLRGILYQWSSRRPMDRNLMLLGVFMLGTLVAGGANLFVGQAWSWGAAAGVMMGAFSFMSNMSMYRGFAVGKASLVAVLTALPAAVVSLGAFILWQEKLTGWQFGALCVILLGIVVIRYSNELNLSNLRGMQWGVLAMLGFAITDLSSKQSQLWHAEVLPTLTAMFATGALLFLIVWRRAVGQTARQYGDGSGKAGNVRVDNGADEVAVTAEKTPSAKGCTPGDIDSVKTAKGEARWSGRRSFLWGMAVGFTNVSGMMLILPAFKLGPAGLVSAVIATSVLLILLFTRLYLKERFTKPQLLGIGMAIAGVMMLKLLG